MAQKKSPNFAMRLSYSDKAKLRELARLMDCNQTDTVRLLIRSTHSVVTDQETKEPTPTTEPAAM